jgi:hypothetical protein
MRTTVNIDIEHTFISLTVIELARYDDFQQGTNQNRLGVSGKTKLRGSEDTVAVVLMSFLVLPRTSKIELFCTRTR